MYRRGSLCEEDFDPEFLANSDDRRTTMQSKTTRRTVMLTPEMDKQLETQAFKSNMNTSMYLRKLIEENIVYKTNIIKEDK